MTMTKTIAAAALALIAAGSTTAVAHAAGHGPLPVQTVAAADGSIPLPCTDLIAADLHAVRAILTGTGVRPALRYARLAAVGCHTAVELSYGR